MAGDTLIIGKCCSTALRIYKMQCQTFLTLHRLSFIGGSDIDTTYIANKGGQYLVYVSRS